MSQADFPGGVQGSGDDDGVPGRNKGKETDTEKDSDQIPPATGNPVTGGDKAVSEEEAESKPAGGVIQGSGDRSGPGGLGNEVMEETDSDHQIWPTMERTDTESGEGGGSEEEVQSKLLQQGINLLAAKDKAELDATDQQANKRQLKNLTKSPKKKVKEERIRAEDDLLLPTANVERMMKKGLPPDAIITRKALKTMQACVSEFLAYLNDEAAAVCKEDERTEMNGDDICSGFERLGFDDYVHPLKRYLERYRDDQREMVASTNTNTNNNDNNDDQEIISRYGESSNLSVAPPLVLPAAVEDEENEEKQEEIAEKSGAA